MERLTGRNEDGELLFKGELVCAGEFYEAVAALENYEGTGYTPAEFHELIIDSECSLEGMEVLKAEYTRLYKAEYLNSIRLEAEKEALREAEVREARLVRENECLRLRIKILEREAEDKECDKCEGSKKMGFIEKIYSMIKG